MAHEVHPEPEEFVGVTGAMGPAVPEQARNVLARAISAQVVWRDADAEPTRSLCASRLAVVEDLPGNAGPPVTVEIADAAPLPVPDRIFSRARISGRAVIDPEDATARKSRSLDGLDGRGWRCRSGVACRV